MENTSLELQTRSLSIGTIVPHLDLSAMASPVKHPSSSRVRFAAASNLNNYRHQQVSFDDDDVMVANEMMIDESPTELAMLLTSVASIAKREIEQLSTPSFMDYNNYPCFPDLGPSSSFKYYDNTSRMYYPEDAPSHPLMHDGMHVDHDLKTRAVSIDIPHRTQANYMQSYPTADHPEDYEDEAIPTLLRLCSARRKPSTSPICISSMTSLLSLPPPPLIMEHSYTNHQKKKRCIVKTAAHVECDIQPRTVSLAEGMVDNHTPSLSPEPTLACLSVNNDPTKPMKIILRRRLNWKNYPELEEFLIGESNPCLCYVVLIVYRS